MSTPSTATLLDNDSTRSGVCATNQSLTDTLINLIGEIGVTIAQKVAVPSTAASTGAVGQYAVSSTYFYVCYATDTWLRVAIATWP